MESRMLLPQARVDGLVVSDVQDETLVYDVESHRAHTLSPVAAVVWRNSDGKHTVADLARLIGGDLDGLSREKAVWSALERLEQAGLMEHHLDKSFMGGEPSRRAFMKGMGRVGAAAGAATVVSLAVPLAAAANTRSCGPVPEGGACNFNTNCQTCCCTVNESTGVGTCRPFSVCAP